MNPDLRAMIDAHRAKLDAQPNVHTEREFRSTEEMNAWLRSTVKHCEIEQRPAPGDAPVKERVIAPPWRQTQQRAEETRKPKAEKKPKSTRHPHTKVDPREQSTCDHLLNGLTLYRKYGKQQGQQRWRCTACAKQYVEGNGRKSGAPAKDRGCDHVGHKHYGAGPGRKRCAGCTGTWAVAA